jgi:DNA-binding response OmpR family regulator
MSMKANILLIEDEFAIVEFLTTGLRYEGFQVKTATNGEIGIKLFLKENIDLIILDIMLPDIDGFQVCKKIRSLNSEIPIIMLTAKKDIKDKIKGLDFGADDYVTKPFSFDELLARIRVQLRKRGKYFVKKILKCNDLILNIETREVVKNGKTINLTPTEFSILELFMQNFKRVFTRETLINRIFGYDFIGDTNVIDVHISHLRDKIGDKPAKLIKTHYGVGYSFQCDE